MSKTKMKEEGAVKDPDQCQTKKEEVEIIETDKTDKGQIDKGNLIILVAMTAQESHIITKKSLTIAGEDPMIIKEVTAKKEANKGKYFFIIGMLGKIITNNSLILKNSRKIMSKKSGWQLEITA
jgi:hypothetical protein